MLRIEAEVLDLDTGLVTELILPCDLSGRLDKSHEYYIVSCEPNIDEWMVDDIWKINSFVDEINSENAEMTVDYVNILLSVSNCRDVLDGEFVRKIKENEFMFENITDCSYGLGTIGNAAKHLVKDAHVPFDDNIPQYIVNALMNPVVEQYIDWDYIWRRYIAMGFQLHVVDDGPAAGEYVILW